MKKTRWKPYRTITGEEAGHITEAAIQKRMAASVFFMPSIIFMDIVWTERLDIPHHQARPNIMSTYFANNTENLPLCCRDK